MSKIIIGTAHGKNVGFDAALLLAGRLLITADSGGGKSWLARVLFEQTSGKIQTIVIDPEGEFASLREKFPFVLAGKGGDTPIDVRSAAMLAHRLLKLRVSAICDLYELRSDLRHEWVSNFLHALIEAPKELRTPLVLGMDELHMFAPEKGQGESIAKQEVIDASTRGRKRGICLAGITQRLAMLDKNVTSQLQNRLIGPTFEDVNIKTAARLLGIAPGKDEREFHRQIVSSKAGCNLVRCRGRRMKRVAKSFEWTFSTRVRERKCCQCPAMTCGFLTSPETGIRRPLCSTCFFAALKQVVPHHAPRQKELPLC